MIRILIVERTCTGIKTCKTEWPNSFCSRLLSSYGEIPAYVLLGGPSFGKTMAIMKESDRDYVIYISTRDFITFGDRHKWHGKILFIDGLDEVRSGSTNAQSSFDLVRSNLEKLGCPKFRLSCREADWFGKGDFERLKQIVPDGTVSELNLDPLPEQNLIVIN